MSLHGAGCRPVGFFLLMVGFGLRLDTAWQGVAWVCLLAGAAVGAAGLWALTERQGVRRAFVTSRRKE